MNEPFEFRRSAGGLPEALVLAVGAMTLLMVGASRGERAAHLGSRSCCWSPLARHLWLPGAGSWPSAAASSSIFARFLKLLALTGSAVAILMSFDYLEGEKQERFEYPILILLRPPA